MSPVKGYVGSSGVVTVMELDFQLAGVAGSLTCIPVTGSLQGVGLDRPDWIFPGFQGVEWEYFVGMWVCWP